MAIAFVPGPILKLIYEEFVLSIAILFSFDTDCGDKTLTRPITVTIGEPLYKFTGEFADISQKIEKKETSSPSLGKHLEYQSLV
jgi:hypothetical protein